MLKNYKKFLNYLFIFFIIGPLYGEEKIDIWNKKSSNNVNENIDEKDLSDEPKKTQSIIDKININPQSKVIQNEVIDKSQEANVFGVYDPSDYNFDLNMWSTTSADDVRASIKRLKKIKLSQTSKEILENILLSFSYPPNGMNEKEFGKLKNQLAN